MEDASSLWGNLPPHLLLNILARFNNLSLLKLRYVCKKLWSALVHDSSFIHLHSYLSRSTPAFLLTETAATALIYIDASSSTACLKLPHIPIASTSSALVVRAAAAGLLCCSEGNCFYVCNLVSEAWKKLPITCGNGVEISQVSLLHNPKANCFQILLVGCKNKSRAMAQLYDSAGNEWKEVDVPQACMNPPPSIPPLLFGCGERVYALMDPFFTRRLLCVFDPQDETWTRVEASWPESCFACHFWRWESNVMMVGEEKGVGLGIWQLLKNGVVSWIRVAFIIIPECGVNGWKAVAGNENMLCIEWKRCCFLYDLTTKSSTWLSLHSADQCSTLIAFTPSLVSI